MSNAQISFVAKSVLAKIHLSGSYLPRSVVWTLGDPVQISLHLESIFRTCLKRSEVGF